MERYSLSHLADRSLLDDLRTLVVRDRATTADLLAHIAEVDHRRLYARAGYPSMRAYCVGELRLSEDAAAKRIQAGRKARQFPAIFAAVADGRLHLTAVNLLAPYLTGETIGELVAAATHRSKTEVELLLAERFPRYDLLEWVEAPEHAPAHAGPPEHAAPHAVPPEHAPAHAGPPEHAAPHVADRARLTPVGPGRYLLQCTLGQSVRERLQYALELMSHRNPSGRISALLGPALEALIAELEKEKFAATGQPRGAAGQGAGPAGGRYIPASVKRAVWLRDGGACTFAAESGRVCGSRWLVEFDHRREVARGGEATVDNVRLRCRTHNQYGAECTFGAGFMDGKRREAMRVRAAEQGGDDGAAAQHGPVQLAAARDAAIRPQSLVDGVLPYLRKLGFAAAEARARAIGACEHLPEGSLADRVRSAISGSYAARAKPAAAA